MRVVQINSVCGYGSTGRIVAGLNETLEENGHTCLAAYGRKHAPGGINSYKIGNSSDIILHGFKTRVFDLEGFGSRKATAGLTEKINRYNPDIIHLHNIHGYYLNIEVLFDFLKRSEAPVIWTLHDCWSITGHCSYFDYIGCERWKTGCFSCPQKSQYPKSLFFDNSKRNYERKKALFTSIDAMTIVTPSLWMKSMVKGSFLSKYTVKVINNGIDLKIFQPAASTKEEIAEIKAKYGCNDKYVILGVASVWEERKGLKHLLELSAKLGETFRTIIVGVNEKQKSSLPDGVIGITRTNDVRQLAEIYTMADIFVNPTLEEVFGLTNIEALACGTPVITYETGGSPECIDDTCGMAVKKGSVDELYRAVHRILDNPFSKDACMARAQRFNKDDKNAEYLSAYHQMLK